MFSARLWCAGTPAGRFLCFHRPSLQPAGLGGVGGAGSDTPTLPLGVSGSAQLSTRLHSSGGRVGGRTVSPGPSRALVLADTREQLCRWSPHDPRLATSPSWR